MQTICFYFVLTILTGGIDAMDEQRDDEDFEEFLGVRI